MLKLTFPVSLAVFSTLCSRPLCSLCEEGYQLSAGGCSKCWSKGTSVALTATVGLAIIIAVCVMVARSTGRRSEVMGVVRVFMNYAQITAAVGSFALKGPALAAKVLSVGDAANGVSLDAWFVQCAMESTYYDRFLAYAVVRQEGGGVCNPHWLLS